MGFNLADVLAGAQVEHDGRMRIEYIRFDNVHSDEQNFYTLSGLEDLAGNIETVGLQQPIVVRPADEEGQYIIVSGHRRRAAWEMLWKSDPMKWAEIPCIVTENDELQELQRLRLIFANCNTRTLTSAELSKQAVEVERCLYALKEKGMEFPGRMRDHVAEAVNASRSKLGRLKIIREGLIPEYMTEWEKGSLPDQTAMALAKLEPALQTEVFGLSVKTGGQTYYKLDTYLQRIKKLPAKCKELDRCYHHSVMKEKMWKASSWEATCDGCCLKCDMLEGCRDACTWCKAVVEKKAQLKAVSREKRQEEKRKEAERAAPAVELLSGVLSRTYERMQAQGLTCQHLRNLGRRVPGYVLSSDLPLLMGCKTLTEDTQIPIGYGYSYSELSGLVEAARKLGCSIDWLLTGAESEFTSSGSTSGAATFPGGEGSEGVPKLGTGWNDTEPENTGWYLVAYELIRGKLFYSRLYWTGSAFLMRKDDPNSCIHASNLRYWIDLPEGDSRG